MCGRFVFSRTSSDLQAVFEIDQVDEDLPRPSFNIAPSEQICVVVEPGSRADADPSPGSDRRLVAARWGLIPRFARSMASGPTPFNARAEKLLDSPLYAGPYATRRAIIPADGFFERRKADRVSYYIHPGDGSVLAFAGVYEWWRPPQVDLPRPGAWVLSTAIVTSDAHGPMARIHDRQPVCLPRDMWAAWLDPGVVGDRDLLEEAVLTSHAVMDALDFRQVGPGWGSTQPGTRRDDPGLIEEWDSTDAP
ncbi:MAG: SOS response-associated peptidase [Propionibacteriaceae bacterium]|nr:SOS response-associated peptidase [Propionibacteriaceae bacterium]